MEEKWMRSGGEGKCFFEKLIVVLLLVVAGIKGHNNLKKILEVFLKLIVGI